MRLFFYYLRSCRRRFLAEGIFCAIFAGSFWLYHLPVKAVLYPMLLCMGIGAVLIAVDFARVRQKHELLQKIHTFTDVLTENLPPAESVTDADHRQIIRLLGEEHNAYRVKTEQKYTDMIEYYTVWVHQIKTPIASMRLHLQKEDTALARKLTSDLHRVEQYVEMVLTFLRLNSESTDYVFKEYDLDEIVKCAVRKFSSDFIGRKLSLVYEPFCTTVVTDKKWLSFVIEQVLSNALKYTLSGSIAITLEGEKTLRIQDTGIGIAPEDLPRIFENGYTGYNGRKDKKSSGIGLYLCKQICSRLGHKITASSTVDVGTVIEINLARQKLDIE